MRLVAGAPTIFTIEQILHLFALACEPPERYQRPINHWSARELADELMKQGVVERISPRHVARLLNEADLKPHQSCYWLTPQKVDEAFEQKVSDIAHTYLSSLERAALGERISQHRRHSH